MPQPSDDGLREYAYNTHIRWIETQVFNTTGGRDLTQYQQLARDDVRRDLRRLGYIDPLEPTWWNNTTPLETRRGEIANRSAKATARVRITATGAVTLPAGFAFQDQDPYGDADAQPALDSARGAYRWELTDEVVFSGAGSQEVTVRATVAGSPHNLCPAGALYLATAQPLVSGVSLLEVLTLGVDHQLARLATYRALELIYTDLMTAEGDLCDVKRKVYAARYKEEYARITASGVEITQDGNNDVSDGEDRLRHGTVRRYRS